jgi:hypothetical protein
MVEWEKMAAAAALLTLAGCETMADPYAGARPLVAVEEEPEWRGLATAHDIDHLEAVDEAWAAALEEARGRGYRAAIDGEGALLDPAAALPRAAPPPGPYRCRIVKLGSQSPRGRPFNAYKPYFCYVEVDEDYLSITKQTGSERPAGWLYEDGEADRLIFLGTLVRGTERATLPYGEDAERDMAGIVERVGPFRYRLVIPWPQHESKLDVIELVPVTD